MIIIIKHPIRYNQNQVKKVMKKDGWMDERKEGRRKCKNMKFDKKLKTCHELFFWFEKKVISKVFNLYNTISTMD